MQPETYNLKPETCNLKPATLNLQNLQPAYHLNLSLIAYP